MKGDPAIGRMGHGLKEGKLMAHKSKVDLMDSPGRFVNRLFTRNSRRIRVRIGMDLIEIRDKIYLKYPMESQLQLDSINNLYCSRVENLDNQIECLELVVIVVYFECFHRMKGT